MYLFQSNMNFRRLIVLTLLALGILGLHRNVLAADENIAGFYSTMTINENGSVGVIERIEYNFGDNQRHGIFRDIPLTAVDGPDIGITVNSVKDEGGRSYHYVESTSGGNLDIKIGDANKTISGLHTYVIDYTVTNVIRPFEDHDELYWNVTGNGWQVSIEKAEAMVIVPGQDTEIKMNCYTGVQGSAEQNCAFGHNLGGAGFHTTQGLNAGEGLTIAASIPLGLVNDTVVANVDAGSSSDVTLSGGDWLFVLFPVFFLLVMAGMIIAVVSRVFHKPGYKGPVVVQYQPPNGLTPLDVGTILDQSVDTKDISSIILDLAVRGYIKIKYTVQEIKFWPDKKDFEFIQLKDDSTLTHPGEKILWNLFFGGGKTVTLSSLLADKETFHEEIERIKTETEDYLREQGYYDKASKEAADKLITKLAIAMVAVIIGSFILSVLTAGLGMILAFPGIIYIIIRMAGAAKLAKQFTPKGLQAQADVTGFKEFLQLTEKDKLELLNAPKLQPETFEKFLPFAMALGVEEQWAKKFEGLYQSTPNWYEDPTHSVFSSTLLIANLQQFNGAFSQAVVAATPHSSGMSGGSSGGGSGGGGGGSW